MKIYTKTGDNGTTSLVGGTRVSKNHQRLECYGSIDELNSHIGLVHDITENVEVKSVLIFIQQKLFNIGSYLATESYSQIQHQIINKNDIFYIENIIDNFTNELPQLTNFILPSGHYSSSSTHVARTVCRRVERLLVSFSQANQVEENILIFINRLSDFLFVLARKFLKDVNKPEIHWNPNFVD